LKFLAHFAPFHHGSKSVAAFCALHNSANLSSVARFGRLNLLSSLNNIQKATGVRAIWRLQARVKLKVQGRSC
jgi:hypothetical protein